MKYQLINSGWPIGQWLIPTGAIIDASANDQWSQLARGRGIPPNAVALDQEAADLMFRIYPRERVLTGPGVHRR